MYPRSVEYSKHSENLAAIKKSLTQIERAHKDAIRAGDAPQIEALQRIHLLTIGILAEATLRKIVVDPIGFNDRERQLIWRVRSQKDRWLESVDLSARRHYKVLIHDPVNAATIGSDEYERYKEVRELLSHDLAPVIEDRNKIAHGQWIWHLKSREENVFKLERPDALPNYSALQGQGRLIEVIGEIVRMFAVSEPAFDRDYRSLMAKFNDAKLRISGAEYPRLVAQLRSGSSRRS